MEVPLELKLARARYWNQKKGAALRGIGWELTFRQWLEWWGDDLDRRGSGFDQLQMQRFADSGPYKIGNIRKGTPRQNGKTMGQMRRTKETLRLAKQLEAARDADEGRDLGPDEISEDEQWLHDNVGWGAKQSLYEPRY